MARDERRLREIDEEIETHIQARVEHLVRQGVSPDDARREALSRFPDGVEGARSRLLAQAESARRRQHTSEYLRQWLSDWRRVARTLVRQPAFSAGVIAILALGLGVNAAVFRVAYDLLLRPPSDVQQASEIRRVESLVSFGSGTPQRATAYSYVDAERLVASAAFLSAGMYTTLRTTSLSDGREILVSEVDGGFFRTLGARVAAGREFTSEEVQPGANQAVALVSHGVWNRLFAGRDLSAGPAEITLGGRAYQIVGVMASGFTGIDLSPVDVWLPLGAASRGRGWVNGVEIPWYRSDMLRAVRVIGRLADGTSDERATAGVTAILAAADAAEQRPARTADLRPIVPVGDANQAGEARQLVGRLVLVALLILIIATANAANLLLAHGLQRQQEVAIRLALGAGRGRVVRLLTLQGLTLAIAGGAAAVVAGHWTAQLLWRSMFPEGRGGPEWFDAITVVATLAMSLIVGVVTGLTPAWQTTRSDVVSALRSSRRLGHQRARLTRTILVAGQTAMSVTLLVLAGLLVMSLVALGRTGLGFQPSGLVTASIVSSLLDPRLRTSFTPQELTTGLPADAVAFSTIAPFGASYVRDITVPGTTFTPESPLDQAHAAEVSTNYFQVMGTRLLEGRHFNAGDTAGSDPVVIISESMKRNYWGATIPPGACILADTCATVIGVVEDLKDAPAATPRMRYYLPLSQTTRPATVAIVSMPSQATAAVVSQLRAAVPAGQRVVIDVIEDRIARATRPWRTATLLFVVLGGLGLVLAAVGIYSVVNFFAAERVPEFGVRMVLGASAEDVLGLVMRDGGKLLIAGAVIGLAGAAVAGQYLGTLLFRVSPFDPLIYAAAIATLAVAAAAAMWRPARRAARINPVQALRGE